MSTPTTQADSLPRALPALLRLLAVPAAISLVLAGIWATGGVVTDDFRASMALTALWFGAVVIGAVAAWRSSRGLRPAAVAAVATFILVGAWLGLASIRDVTVNEQVAAGPALVSGSFRGLAHPTEGVVRIVEQPAGSRVVTLTSFRTDPGPDLYVYAIPGRSDGSDVDGGIRLGRLKGNVGNQQYGVPADFPSGPATVVVWCRAFSVSFGAAQLAAPG